MTRHIGEHVPRLAKRLLTQSKKNVAALELMRHLGVCCKTGWLVKHKLMEVMGVREDTRQLEGRVELDDAYLGGKRSGGKASTRLPQFKAITTHTRTACPRAERSGRS